MIFRQNSAGFQLKGPTQNKQITQKLQEKNELKFIVVKSGNIIIDDDVWQDWLRAGPLESDSMFTTTKRFVYIDAYSPFISHYSCSIMRVDGLWMWRYMFIYFFIWLYIIVQSCFGNPWIRLRNACSVRFSLV